jgi:carbonic anhydrase/acetyltransferase-like protein (isoleucine patch superfamily)
MLKAFEGAAPEVHATAWVAGDALLIGNVKVGADSGIWYGTVVRADVCRISIGERSNVQDACVLHADTGGRLTVGDGVTVGHGAILHGCRIGDDTLVGMRATVLEGAMVGRNCIIAAGALVPPGMEIPDGSVAMGVPAKVVRPAGPADLEAVRASSERYRALKERHRGLWP